MLNKLVYNTILFLFIVNFISAQNDDELIIRKGSVPVKGSIVINQGIDPLSPARASFYSAVLPGLGQIYNKKYWKAPIVWIAIGTGVYFYDRNDKDFNRFRAAFKLERAGKPHEFDGTGTNPLLTEAGLERAQNVLKKNRDLALFITIGLYALNILEANIDAHLPDNALDTNLSFKPAFFISPVTNQAMAGITINFSF